MRNPCNSRVEGTSVKGRTVNLRR